MEIPLKCLFLFIGTLLISGFGPFSLAMARTATEKDEVSQSVASIEEIVFVRGRFKQWLEAIEKARTAGSKIRVPIKHTAFPIASPKIYNDFGIAKRFEEWKRTLPSNVAAILLSSQAIPPSIPVPAAKFLQIAAQLEMIYRDALRWKSQMGTPWDREASLRRSVKDLSGFDFLREIMKRPEKLRKISNLSAAEKNRIQDAFIRMCRNQFDMNNFEEAQKCDHEIRRFIAENGKMNDLYEKYRSASEKIWNGLFEISPNYLRKDIAVYNENGIVVFEVPFVDPGKEVIWNFLKTQVESAWKGPGWRLRLVKVSSANLPGVSKTASISFRAGKLPTTIMGHTILMDENTDLDDPIAQNTIKHEFGHVLGFPDCYLEFFDSSLSSMTLYELNQEDLMCSSAGTVLPSHFEKMKKAYGISMGNER